MIASLSGVIIESRLLQVVIEAGGVHPSFALPQTKGVKIPQFVTRKLNVSLSMWRFVPFHVALENFELEVDF